MGTRQAQGMEMAMSLAIHHNMDSLRRLDSLNSLFGSAFWGYGINSISDGIETHSHHDVEVIRGIPGLNKHHEAYRKLLLLSFKVEQGSLYVSSFSIDSCKAEVNSNINTRYDLNDFQNATMKTRPNAIFVEFVFKGVAKPISFQVDTYHFGGYNLSSQQLAKYYIDSIKEMAKKLLSIEASSNGTKELNLNKDIEKMEKVLRGIVVDTLCVSKRKSDFSELLTGDVKSQVKNRIKEHMALHPNLKDSDFASLTTAIQFCDIEHLKRIILKTENWIYFENFFKDKDKVLKYFEGFNNLRKAIMHSREVTELVKLEGKAAMEWFTMIIKLKNSFGE